MEYDVRQHDVYHRGRQHPSRTRELWRQRFLSCAGAHPPRKWLDIGSGTGRFSVELADLFGAAVTGIEPSAAMRAEANRVNHHSAIEYLEGQAESIPLPDASFHAALMSMVYHHLTDPCLAAQEIARVLRPGGQLWIRSATTDRHMDSSFYRFFEGARVIDQERLPAMGDLQTFGKSGGLVQVHHEVVAQCTDESLIAFRDRMRLRPFSTFDLMTETEIENGFSGLEGALARGESGPAVEYVDLLVLELPRA